MMTCWRSVYIDQSLEPEIHLSEKLTNSTSVARFERIATLTITDDDVVETYYHQMERWLRSGGEFWNIDIAPESWKLRTRTLITKHHLVCMEV